MNAEQQSIFVERSLWSRGVRIHFGVRNERGDLWVAAPATMTKHDTGELTSPLLELSAVTAQALMDQLWTAGVRPTEAKAGDGQIEALQAHIKDLRHLVMHPLAIAEAAMSVKKR